MLLKRKSNIDCVVLDVAWHYVRSTISSRRFFYTSDPLIRGSPRTISYHLKGSQHKNLHWIHPWSRNPGIQERVCTTYIPRYIWNFNVMAWTFQAWTSTTCGEVYADAVRPLDQILGISYNGSTWADALDLCYARSSRSTEYRAQLFWFSIDFFWSKIFWRWRHLMYIA